MTTKPTIQETLTQSYKGGQALVIRVPMEAEPVVLLTTPNRSIAFVMWEKLIHTPASLVAFKTRVATQHSVACSCIRIGSLGLEMPENDILAEDEWRAAMDYRFAKQILQTCKEHDIRHLLVHHAEGWHRFGLPESEVQVFEASRALELQRYLYTDFPFLDWDKFFNPRPST